jgi:hypothetical protein
MCESRCGLLEANGHEHPRPGTRIVKLESLRKEAKP